jgi:hypothetical protein
MVSSWEIPTTEAVKDLIFKQEAERRRRAKDAGPDAASTARRGQSAQPAKRKRAGSGVSRGESEEDTEESEEDTSDFVPDAETIKRIMIRDNIMLSVQSEAITGLGVQKLIKLRKDVGNSDEFKRQKPFATLLDATIFLAEDNRKSHQHTSMLLVSEICLQQKKLMLSIKLIPPSLTSLRLVSPVAIAFRSSHALSSL